MNYLDRLPEEIYREIVKYMYAEVVAQVYAIMPLAEHMWPPTELHKALQNGSDHVRSESLNNSYRRGVRHYKEADWYKLLIDLERPCVCHRDFGFEDVVPWWLMRRCRVFDVSASGQFWWNTCNQPAHLTYAGWCRLTNTNTTRVRVPR